jgi:membrane-associated protease RseP (regulator of RpoE activity)
VSPIQLRHRNPLLRPRRQTGSAITTALVLLMVASLALLAVVTLRVFSQGSAGETPSERTGSASITAADRPRSGSTVADSEAGDSSSSSSSSSFSPRRAASGGSKDRSPDKAQSDARTGSEELRRDQSDDDSRLAESESSTNRSGRRPSKDSNGAGLGVNLNASSQDTESGNSATTGGIAVGTIPPGTKLHAAGLDAGDVIISVNGVPVDGWADVRQIMDDDPGAPLEPVWVKPDGTKESASITGIFCCVIEEQR